MADFLFNEVFQNSSHYHRSYAARNGSYQTCFRSNFIKLEVAYHFAVLILISEIDRNYAVFNHTASDKSRFSDAGYDYVCPNRMLLRIFCMLIYYGYVRAVLR